MSLPLVTIRPEPGATQTVEAGRREGLEIAAFPLSEVHPLAWQAPEAGSCDALLLGSANALRHGGAELDRLPRLPAYCVGHATAEAARGAGFPVAATGSGGLQPLLDKLAGERLRLLRLAGAEHVPLAAPEGVTITGRIVYETRLRSLPDELASLLAGGALVLLHSAAAARHFAGECERLGIDRGRVVLAALGPRIAAAAGSGWRGLEVAQNPSDEALLSLARHMCH